MQEESTHCKTTSSIYKGMQRVFPGGWGVGVVQRIWKGIETGSMYRRIVWRVRKCAE